MLKNMQHVAIIEGSPARAFAPAPAKVSRTCSAFKRASASKDAPLPRHTAAFLPVAHQRAASRVVTCSVAAPPVVGLLHVSAFYSFAVCCIDAPRLACIYDSRHLLCICYCVHTVDPLVWRPVHTSEHRAETAPQAGQTACQMLARDIESKAHTHSFLRMLHIIPTRG
jgi:hypothetical protein